jgi:hypothetical protein
MLNWSKGAETLTWKVNRTPLPELLGWVGPIREPWWRVLGAFTTLREAAVSFVVPVRMELLGIHRTGFHETWYLRSYRKSVKKKVSLNYYKSNGCVTCSPMLIYDNVSLIFFSEWEIFQTEVVEEIKTHIVIFIFFCRNSCRLWDSKENIWYSQTQMTITTQALRMPGV